jgi:hypothetical protein
MMPSALFLPANTRASGLILVNDETSGMLYTSTTHGCGSTDDSVWGIDLVKAEKPVTSWKAGGARIVGAPTLGRDGTIHVATAAGKTSLSNSIVALEPKTLKQKAQVVIPDANVGGSPIVFSLKDKEVLAVAGAGRISLLDAAVLSGAPLATSAPYGSGAAHPSSLATWQDAQGVRWILVTSPGPAPSGFASNGPVANGSIVAFKVLDQDGKLSIQPAWVSRDLVAPLTPLVVTAWCSRHRAVSSRRRTPGCRQPIGSGSRSLPCSTPWKARPAANCGTAEPRSARSRARVSPEAQASCTSRPTTAPSTRLACRSRSK